MRAVFVFLLSLIAWRAVAGSTPAEAGKPAKTSVCELARHPAEFDGKLVEVRAIVESGLSDLPAAVTDERCGAQVKFFMPDDPQFAKLVKSKGFKKLIKEVKQNPVVEATVTGHFKRVGTEAKGEYGLALESADDVKAKPLPRLPRDR